MLSSRTLPRWSATRSPSSLIGAWARNVDVAVLVRAGQDLLAAELGDHLLILDRDVGAALIPVDQLLDRRRQVLVGGNHSNELADIERAGQCEVATDGIEEKRRDLRQQQVEILDCVLSFVERNADLEEVGQPSADLGFGIIGRAVTVDQRRTVDHLTNAA